MHPYKIAGLLLGAFAVLCLGFIAIGFILPHRWEVERTTDIDAPPETVYGMIESGRRWEDWMVTPETGLERFGPETGDGSGFRWDDPGYGKGEFVIAGSAPPSTLDYRVLVEDGAIAITGQLTLERNGDATRVVWRERGDFGWNPLLGYMASRMGDLQGVQLEGSLAALKGLAEGETTEATPPPG